MPKEHLPFVMTLEPTAEARVRGAVREIARLPFLVQPPLLLPFVDFPSLSHGPTEDFSALSGNATPAKAHLNMA